MIDAPPQMADLPQAAELDLSPLVRSMRSVTNSYKHLLLRAILRNVPTSRDGFLPYHELFRGMLEEAWWPAFHYRLSLGKSDKVVSLLERAIPDPDQLRVRPEDVPELIRTVPFDGKEQRTRGLLRYVPQRLIVPWFEAEVRGTGREDQMIPGLSVERFDTVRPLYAIRDDGLQLHPAWHAHLLKWHSVFMGWSDARWIEFLEARNPHAIGLLAKIRPAFERTPLVAQRRIWGEAATIAPFACIYTGVRIDPAFFALDHFLPHAFVGHDRFWNLCPTAPEINLQKRDALPDRGFVHHLAEQHAGLHAVAAKLSPGARQDLRRVHDEYAVDLGLDGAVLSDAAVLNRAYGESIDLLRGIAGRMGFPLDWSPTSW